MKKNIKFKVAFLMFLITSSLFIKAQSVHQSGITFIDFNVAMNQNKININWSTDNANSTNYFVVEKSSDGKNFKTVAYVLGADPAKTSRDYYGYFGKEDKSPDKSYYRLKHIDNKGVVEFSDVKILALK